MAYPKAACLKATWPEAKPVSEKSPLQRRFWPKEDLVAPKSREYQPQASDSRAIVADVPISTCRLQPPAGGLATGGKQTASLKGEIHKHHHCKHNDG